MKPHSTKIRRILPYTLPVSIALLAVGWMVLPEGSTKATAEMAPATVNADSKSPAIAKSPSLEKIRAVEQRAFIKAAAEASEPPRNPEVAELLSKFRESDQLLPVTLLKGLGQIEKGKHTTLKFAGIELSGTVDSKLDSSGVLLLGLTLDDGLGRFHMSLRPDERIAANVFFYGEEHAFSITGFPENGAWKIRKNTVSRIYCAEPGAVYPDPKQAKIALRPGGSTNKPLPPQGNFKVPDLSSNPESTFVIYIDFDGEVVTNPAWNNGETINSEPASFFGDEDAMRFFWARVSEDFAPFDVNVTTSRAVYDSTAPERRTMGIVGVTSDWAPIPGLDGIAPDIGAFGQEAPFWTFENRLAEDDAFHAETYSHECGHVVGLSHDGTSLQTYGPGQGSGATSWAPIMGDYTQDYYQPELDEEVTTWSKGDYEDADNQEDDLQIMSTINGFGYRKDDKGNSQAEAGTLVVVDGTISDSGLISETADTDWFLFSTSGGEVTINANVLDVQSDTKPQRGANLAVSMDLYDADGKVVATSNPPDALDATITQTLAAGTYAIKIDGAGRGTLATGFSDYASLGQYTLTGTVPQVNLLTITPATSEFTKEGGKGQFQVKSTSAWAWASSETWVTSTEAVDQNGKQTFDFTVAPNNTRVTRTAVITVTATGSSATHLITQEAADDHGDTIATATLVDQKSVTDGELEEEGDLDVFRIDVKGFGNLTVKSSGTTNTYGELLDFNGTRLTANDNGLKPNFKIVYSVAPGTYYARVRHALESGTGPYKLVCLFTKGPALSLDPPSRTVSASRATLGIDVVSNTTWRWSTESPWLQIKEPKNQEGGQLFEYTVLRNTSGKSRSAKIVFEAGNSRVTHTVNQNAPLNDDHPNSTAGATQFATNSAVNGEFEAQGDLDMFRIRLATSGELNLKTLGFTDTYGELINSKGKVIAFNDDSDGGNFAMTHAVNAGTYYVKVRHFKGSELGAYRLVNEFTPSSLITLTYTATEGGYLRGDLSQTVRLGGTGRKVTAIAKSGYSFQRWSDGVGSPTRTDQDSRSHLNVVARFARTLSVRVAGGEVLQDNQIPPVDFGLVRIDDVRRIKFEVRNNSSKILTGLRVGKSGSDPEAWNLALPANSLKPGHSVTLTATLKGDTIGSKLAVFTVSANEAVFNDFRIQVMGVVALNSRKVTETSASLDGSARSLGTGDVLLPGITSSLGKATTSTASVSDSWLSVSPDGVFRYRFFRERGYSEVPELWISANGETWLQAEVVSVQRVGTAGRMDEFEAVLSPNAESGLVLAVSESRPDAVKP